MENFPRQARSASQCCVSLDTLKSVVKNGHHGRHEMGIRASGLKVKSERERQRECDRKIELCLVTARPERPCSRFCCPGPEAAL